jgi:hypothetical protein
MTGKRLILCGILAFLVLAQSILVPLAASGADGDYDIGNDAKYIKDLDLYYSDSYFYGSSEEYNPHLATLSLYMADASMVLGRPDSKTDTKWYQSQSNRIHSYYNAIGFDSFDCNEDYKTPTRFDTIGIAVAKKQISVNGKEFTVIGLTPRSGGYHSEWGNNVWLGYGPTSDYMHEGWYNAAKKAIWFLDDYIVKNNIQGDIKLWITGFSRGGATANLIAGILDDRIDKGEKIFPTVDVKRENIYTYTFEAPQGANINTKGMKHPRDAIYNNIWNIIDPNDIVPKVAMSQWGFTRFGNDVFTNTEFFEPFQYAFYMLTYEALCSDSGDKWSDYNAESITMYGIPMEKELLLATGFITTLLSTTTPIPGTTLISALTAYKNTSDILEEDKRKANYDPNILEMLLIEEITNHIGSREDYCDKYQTYVSSLLLIYMDDCSCKKDTTEGEAVSAMMTGLALGAASYMTSGVIGTLFKFSTDVNELNSKAAIEALLPVLNETYKNRPSELISLAMSSPNILQNHNPSYIKIHMKAQDSNYIDAWNVAHMRHIFKVDLSKKADMARASFFGFNDLKLHKESIDGDVAVNIEGHVLGRSDMKHCETGYAAGYYSYVSEEKMELFFPVDVKYGLAMKSYSKKVSHVIEYRLCYQFNSIGKENTIDVLIHDYYDVVSLNSDTIIDEPQRTVKEMMESRIHGGTIDDDPPYADKTVHNYLYDAIIVLILLGIVAFIFRGRKS